MPFIQEPVYIVTVLLLLIAVIGAFCDIKALINSGNVAGILLIWVTIIVFMHGILFSWSEVY